MMDFEIELQTQEEKQKEKAGIKDRDSLFQRVIVFIIMLIMLFGLTFCYVKAVKGADVEHYDAAVFLKFNMMNNFIKPLPISFKVDTEIEGIVKVVHWLQVRYKYKYDTEPYHYWTTADTMFTRLEGDCEDWSMLLVSLLRFSISKPIPSNRIWVMGSITPEGKHAWVLYETLLGFYYAIDVIDGVYCVTPGIELNQLHFDFNDKERTIYRWTW